MTDHRLIAQRLEVARAVVADAAALAMAMRPPPGGPVGSMKGVQDYVTEADMAVEALVSKRIEALFPEDGFMGEEGGRQREGGLTWVIDLLTERPTTRAEGSAGASRWVSWRVPYPLPE